MRGNVDSESLMLKKYMNLYKTVSHLKKKREGCVDCIFLDYYKAFDNLPHRRSIQTGIPMD